MKEERENKVFVTFLWNDIKRGMFKNRVKYLVALLFTVMCVCILSRTIRTYQQLGDVIGNAGFFDYILYMVHGIPEYIPKKENIFQMPALWLAMNLLPAFLVYSYAVKDTEDMGMYMLLKYKSRTAWWMSKCIWNIVSICAMHLIIWITIFCAVFFVNRTFDGMWTLNGDICTNIMKITDPALTQINYVQNGLFLSAILFLPLLINMGMSLIQMSLSLVIGPVLSFVMVLVVYVLSAYFMYPALIGNYTMMMRNSMILGKSGMDTLTGIVIAFVIGVTGVLSGLIFFRKMDVLGKE